MLRPTPAQLELLEPFERTAFAVCDTVNRRPALKRLAHAFLASAGKTWVHQCTKSLLHVYHDESLDHLDRLHPDRGVVLVANHRSFFDLYVVASVLLRRTSWIDRMYFPVRSNYFYERPDGIAVNALMSALAMYPPIIRRQSARSFNQFSLDLLVELARARGTIVGMHPEGTRNKGDDPYTLLPAQPGVGELIHRARPIVLPVFVLGLGNDIVSQVKSNFDGTGEPITMVFGEPLDLEAFYAQPGRLRTYKRLGDEVRARLVDLGEVERRIRLREGFPDKGVSASPARRTTTPSAPPPRARGEAAS